MLNIQTSYITANDTRRRIRSFFKGLKFREEDHTYRISGKELISSTAYIKQFKEEFNESKVAETKAFLTNRSNKSSRRRTKNFYLRRWDNQRTAASCSGSRVHEYAEYNYPEFLDEPACEQEYGVILFFEYIKEQYEVVLMECRMYHKQFPRSGTTDMILQNRLTKDFVIADWKTNQTNILQYWEDQRLFPPFSHLYDHDVNMYSLQICDYQNMLEQIPGVKVEERWIIHLGKNDYTKPDFSKRNDPSYKIDIDNKPEVEYDYFSIYKGKDYSQELKKQYIIDFEHE